MKLCLLLALILISLDAHAELGKWRDAEGKVHYSDESPPVNAKLEQLYIPSEQAASVAALTASRSLAEQEAAFR